MPEFVLPDAENSPTDSDQFPSLALVPKSICLDFLFPVMSIRLRHSQMSATSMPKAAVNKHGQALAIKYEIRLAENFLRRTEIVFHPVLQKQTFQLSFQSGIYSSNPAHHPRSSASAKRVHCKYYSL